MITTKIGINEWVLFKASLKCDSFDLPPGLLLIRFIETVKARTLTTPNFERWVLPAVVSNTSNIRIELEVTDIKVDEDLPNGIIYMPANTEYKIEYWVKDAYREDIIDGQDVLLFTDLGQLTQYK